MTVPNGKAIDQNVRDASVVDRTTDKVKITYDVAKGAGGVSIHQFSGPFDEKDAGMVKRFGNASLFFAARDDAILLTFGEDGLPALQNVLAKMSEGSVPGSAVPIAAVGAWPTWPSWSTPRTTRSGGRLPRFIQARPRNAIASLWN